MPERDGNDDGSAERRDAECPEAGGEHPVKGAGSKTPVENTSDFALFLLGIGLVVGGALMVQFPLPFRLSLPLLSMSGNIAWVLLLVGVALLIIAPRRARRRREDR